LPVFRRLISFSSAAACARSWNDTKNLRDLYRLKVAAHNVIDSQYLAGVAACMGYAGENAASWLFDDFRRRSEKVA